ncbi:ATP-grasp domain-containing protein [Microbulbifer epialgicus]|uniref:Acetyl-CoA carboxylase biotin carboxylase subunit family protein n=1 Tax=Microbulbifer epialgicus TaxID=393907 RepID=A0ABV4P2J5_9GAMM
MPPQLVLISHVLHPAVTQGFTPAAIELGYEITIVTDHGLAYRKHYASHPSHPSPVRILECDVFNPIAIIDALTTAAIVPQAVFSNSDHLQSSTALVANYFSLPAKSWQRCYQAKNKAAMRLQLQNLSLSSVESVVLQITDPVPDDLSYPVVAKPREGVGSMNVALCENRRALESIRRDYHRSSPTVPLLLESYMPGELFTLETLSDGREIIAVGGFDVELSPPPHFVELSATWNGENSVRYRDEALAQVRKFGVGLGVCHSEFIVTSTGPKLVEINCRSVGDSREFLLEELLPGGWFKPILQLHTGAPLTPVELGKSQAMIRYLVATSEGQLTRHSSECHWEAQGVKYHYRPLKQQGDAIELTQSNKDYLGVLVAITPSELPLAELVELQLSKLEWEVVA